MRASPIPHASPRRRARLALVVLLAACGGGGGGDAGGSGGPAAPATAGSLAVAVGGGTLAVTTGAAGTAPVTVTRAGGFTGPVTLSAEGVPAGITATFDPATLDGGATASTLTLRAAVGASAGAAVLTVRARGAGVRDAAASLALAVAAPPPITVTLTQVTAPLPVGATLQLRATVRNAADTTLRWSSAEPRVATVSSAGVVTGVAAGTALVTVRSAVDSTARDVALITVASAAAGTPLTSGTPVTGLAGAEDSERLYRIAVPAGATRLEIRTGGGTGDLDLFVRRGQPPAPGAVDCASVGDATEEACVIPNPAAGDWYVLLVAFQAYSGVTLTPTVTGGTTAPAFVLGVAPTSVSVAQGGSVGLTVSATRSGGFAGDVEVSVSGLPAGVTAPTATIAAGATSATLAVVAAQSAAVGSATLTLRARATGLPDQTVAVPLTVTAAGGYTLAASAASLTVPNGQSGTATATVTRAAGFGGTVALSVAGLPAGVTATLAPTSLAGTQATSTLTLAVGAGAAAGTYPLTLRGTATGLVDRTAALSLVIPAAGVGGTTGSVASFTTVDLPGFSFPSFPTAVPDFTSIFATNDGLYIHMSRTGSNMLPRNSQVLKRTTSGRWMTWDAPVSVATFMPVAKTRESVDAFSFLWAGVEYATAKALWGTYTVNTGGVSRQGPDNMPLSRLVSGGEGTMFRQAWALSGDEVYIDDQRYVPHDSSSDPFTTPIARLPLSSGRTVVAAREDDLELWLGEGTALYGVSGTGQVRRFDLSAFGTARINTLIHLDTRLWIGYGTKILRLEGGQLVEFAAVANAPSGGEVGALFCTNGAHVYTADGMRITTTTRTAESFLTGGGTLSSTDQARLTELQTALRSGGVYCPRDPTSRTVYVVNGSNGKLYTISAR